MKVYVDCGANVGMILERNIEKFDVFHAFEANPHLIPTLENIKTKYPNKRIHIYNVAVWTQPGVMNFFLGPGTAPTGSSLIRAKKTGQLDFAKPTQIPTIDLADWIKKNLSKQDFNFFKVDIEGAEYDVFEHLEKANVLDFISELLIEFHWHKLNLPGIKQRHDNILNKLKTSKIKSFHHELSGAKKI